MSVPDFKDLKRHIIVDNENKVIHIQVMQRIDGVLKTAEYDAIMAGYGLQFVPHDFKPVIAKAVADGYTMQPMQTIGVQNGSAYMLNIIELRKKQSPLIMPN